VNPFDIDRLVLLFKILASVSRILLIETIRLRVLFQNVSISLQARYARGQTSATLQLSIDDSSLRL
jgi:hypothetical protein